MSDVGEEKQTRSPLTLIPPTPHPQYKNPDAYLIFWLKTITYNHVIQLDVIQMDPSFFFASVPINFTKLCNGIRG